MLGICYGMQLLAYQLGGKVEPGQKREYGPAEIDIAPDSPLFHGMEPVQRVWMSHGDKLTLLPRGFAAIGCTENAPHAAIADQSRRLFGLQFHPEVHHTPNGKQIISNFVHGVCGCGRELDDAIFIEQAVEEIRAQGRQGPRDPRLVAAAWIRAWRRRCFTRPSATSSPASSSTTACCARARPKRSSDVFGQQFHIKLHYEDATKLFLRGSQGVTDPERKRKIIGRTFIEVFQKATKKAGAAKFLAQGTLYPDVIESVPIAGNPAAMIKSHHNVGGLPKQMKFELLEPLRNACSRTKCAKSARNSACRRRSSGASRSPARAWPCAFSAKSRPQRLQILREADWIVIDEMKSSGSVLPDLAERSPCCLPVRSVGVMGDERTYDNVIAIRAVE